MKKLLLVVVATLPICAGLLAQGQTSRPAPDVYGELRWRYVGPEGNRISAVAGVPGDPLVYYAGSASGGIAKTTDGGVHWQQIFDDQPVQSIGALAVAPSDPDIVWAGTGEAWIRSHISIGEGIYKSSDAGKTWTRMGLEKTGRIGRVVIDPVNPQIVLACALGTAYGPQPERGVFRTTDGGATWQRTLFVDENSGCSEIAANPSNPRILFAGMWQIEIHTWGRESGGPGSGVFMSRDGGATLVPQTGLEAPGGDHHDMWVDPTNGNRMIVGHDQGVSISQTRGRTWLKQRLPNAQLYHVTVDNQIPYYLYTNKQDGPSYRGPSNSRLDEGGGRGGGGRGGIIPRSMWHTVGGGESGWATPDPVDPNIVWSSASGTGSVRGIRVASEENRRLGRDVEVWPD